MKTRIVLFLALVGGGWIAGAIAAETAREIEARSLSGDDWVKILTAVGTCATTIGIAIVGILSAIGRRDAKISAKALEVKTESAAELVAQKTEDVAKRLEIKTDDATRMIAEKTDRQTEAIVQKTDEIKDKTTAVHELVNGRMTKVLNEKAALAVRLAAMPGATESDKEVAKQAMDDLAAHINREDGK